MQIESVCQVSPIFIHAASTNQPNETAAHFSAPRLRFNRKTRYYCGAFNFRPAVYKRIFVFINRVILHVIK